MRLFLTMLARHLQRWPFSVSRLLSLFENRQPMLLFVVLWLGIAHVGFWK